MTNEQNKQRIADFFRQGCKTDKTVGFGVEIEHIPVNPETLEAIPYYGEHGIEAILKDISRVLHGEKILSESRIVGLNCPDYSVTLEPAAQFEISIRPCMDIAQIRQIYRKFRSLVDPVFHSHGAILMNIGYQPASHVDDLKLIPKKRYVYMDRFFKTSGTYGRNMMRGTASTQVSIDYSSEKDFVRKIRLAYMLGPILALLTDNAPVFEGAPVENHMMRTQIWQSVDPARCGIIPGIEKPDFGFNDYVDFLWNMPLILKTQGSKTIETKELTTAEIYADELLTDEDVAHIVSMDFPDVRLKQYVEIRMADSLPEEGVMAYAALIKGIFGNDETIKILSKRYPMNIEKLTKAQASLIEDGFDGEIYGKNACDFAKEILTLAFHNLNIGENAFLKPLYECVAKKQTWAMQAKAKEADV